MAATKWRGVRLSQATRPLLPLVESSLEAFDAQGWVMRAPISILAARMASKHRAERFRKPFVLERMQHVYADGSVQVSWSFKRGVGGQKL